MITYDVVAIAFHDVRQFIPRRQNDVARIDSVVGAGRHFDRRPAMKVFHCLFRREQTRAARAGMEQQSCCKFHRTER